MPYEAPTTNGRTVSRRQYLRATGAAAAALACAGQGPSQTAAQTPARKPHSPLPFQLGLASYTFRGFDLGKTLAMTQRVGLKHICLKSFHLPLEAKPVEIAAAAAQVKRAGVTLYGGGVISMRNAEEIGQAFEYAKAAGMRLINAAPTAEMLPLVNEKVKHYGIAVAIHNHGPGDKHFPTPQSVYDKVSDLDRRIGLCIDVGHTVRVGADLIDSTRRYADRLLDVHLKDVTAATPKGSEIEVGRGVIDIPEFLRTLIQVKFAGVVAFEYEGQPGDPLPGLAESVGYAKGVLAVL